MCAVRVMVWCGRAAHPSNLAGQRLWKCVQGKRRVPRHGGHCGSVYVCVCSRETKSTPSWTTRGHPHSSSPSLDIHSEVCTHTHTCRTRTRIRRVNAWLAYPALVFLRPHCSCVPQAIHCSCVFNGLYCAHTLYCSIPALSRLLVAISSADTHQNIEQ